MRLYICKHPRAAVLAQDENQARILLRERLRSRRIRASNLTDPGESRAVKTLQEQLLASEEVEEFHDKPEGWEKHPDVSHLAAAGVASSAD